MTPAAQNHAPLWTSAEAQAATQGQASGPAWSANGISIDSRSVGPGDLFVALAGPTHDGHDYVATALAAGAVAALIHTRPADLPKDAPVLLVKDTLVGLNALGAAARARSEARVIAVTGSVGKTSTKEMLKLALEPSGLTHASVGSFNNHWGVPLSLARLPREASFAVFELGMNHPGEITPLTRLVRPHVAIVTSIEAVHLEFFTSTEEIAKAKAEIFLGVEPGGVVILPRDSLHFGLLRSAAKGVGIRGFSSFGTHIDSSARLLDYAIDPDATVVFALFEDDAISYRVGVPGRQWALNSLAVLLATQAVGIPIYAAAPTLAVMSAPKGRGERSILPWLGGSIDIIDESYNASPVSTRAAIAALGAVKPSLGGRRIAVLGDMLELGETSPRLHAGLASTVVDSRVQLVFTSGPLMQNLHNALPANLRGGHGGDADETARLLATVLQPGDVVMVKGSAGSRMSRVVKALTNAATTAVIGQ